jgi:hypothetical protein
MFGGALLFATLPRGYHHALRRDPMPAFADERYH